VAMISEVVSELYTLKGMSFEECNNFFFSFSGSRRQGLQFTKSI
jgi:hypothetical protein